MSSACARWTAVLVLLALLVGPVTAQAFNNPYHANVEGVDYIPKDGNNYTFYATIYSEDDTGDSEPLYWEALADNNTVIHHNITDPVEEEDAPRYHSEGTYPISNDIEILTFRAYDSEHGYGGATVEVDIAREDFQNEEADPINTDTADDGTADGDGEDGNETEDGTASGPMGGASGSGDGNGTAGQDGSSADITTNGTDDSDTDEGGITDQVEDSVDEFTDGIEEASGGFPPLVLLLIVGLLIIAGIWVYRSADAR